MRCSPPPPLIFAYLAWFAVDRSWNFNFANAALVDAVHKFPIPILVS